MKSLTVSCVLALSLAATQSSALSVAPPDAVIAQGIDRLFAGNQGDTRAVLLIRDGKIAAKRYAPGYSDDTRFISWSMAKSVTAVLIGELVADGKLALDAPVPFAEWHKPGDPRAAITLRHMLHMSSGLDHTEGLDPADGVKGVLNSDTTQTLFVSGTQAMAAAALAPGMEAKPGAKFEYSSLTSLLLAELITRQLTDSSDPKVRAMAYTSFARERLFKPAGIKSAVLEFDGAGTQIGGSIMHMPLDDWGRFGQLLLAGKGPDGTQIIAPDWLAFLKTPSATNPSYGGHVWLNRAGLGDREGSPSLFPGRGPDTLFSAIGHLGQFVIVSPDQGLVLVRLGKTNDDKLQPVRDALGLLVAGLTTGEKE
jgi:CubicO group peptidase (beta-lactamase class C family)